VSVNSKDVNDPPMYRQGRIHGIGVIPSSRVVDTKRTVQE